MLLSEHFKLASAMSLPHVDFGTCCEQAGRSALGVCLDLQLLPAVHFSSPKL